MNLRLHIKGTEIKQLHNQESKSYHLVTFQSKVSMEEFIDILKNAKNSVINAEIKI